MIVYFDNASTTRVRDEAAEIMLKTAAEDYGNPSSAHAAGRRAAGILEAARSHVARALGASPGEIVFTSGGTEANNLAIFGALDALRGKGRHVITTAAEHDSIRRTFQKLSQSGWDVTYLAPDRTGRVTLPDFQAALRPDTALVSVILVNNEVGAINPVGGMASELRRQNSGALLHTDAVQAFCKIAFTPKSLGADLVTVSAHKIHGPKGAGALFVKSGVKLAPRTCGGGQERGLRAGTEAVPAIAAFGEAARLAASERDENAERAGKLYEYTVRLISEKLPGAAVISRGGSPYILSVSLPGYNNENIMNFLEGEGVCVSRSSACKKGAKSHVLEAMRLPRDVANGAIRVSFSRYSTLEEADYFVDRLREASEKLFKVLR